MNAPDVLLPRPQSAVDRGAPIPPTVVAAHHAFDAPPVGALGDSPTRTDHRHATKELA